MRYHHRFSVRAPIAQVTAFHYDASNLARLTPPPMGVKLYHAPDRPYEGAEMYFELVLGPLKVPWQAEFEAVRNREFTDVQLAGPFASWRHTHRFHAIGDAHTEIEDLIEARLRFHPVWGFFGLVLWAGMPVFFRHRVRQTRAVLEE